MDETCTVTVFTAYDAPTIAQVEWRGIPKTQTYWGTSAPCGQPLAPGAKFCAKHEADRIRLSR